MDKSQSESRGVVGRLGTWWLLATALAAPVQAEYRDPLELPAVQSPASRYSLMLDVTAAGERIVAVGERGFVIYSDDNGATWTQAEVETRMQLNAVTFADDRHGWAVGEDAVILHTSDGGKSWRRQFDDRDADLKGPLLDIWCRDASECLAVGVYNKLFHTADGGTTWENASERVDNLDEWHLFSISVTSDGNLYLGSEMGLLFVSTDGGESFAPVQTDHTGSFQNILAASGDGGDNLLMFGPGGSLWLSRDGGESAEELDTGIDTGLSGGAWLEDGSALIVGADGVLLHGDANLANWRAEAQDNALPLANVLITDTHTYLVGFGGVQVIDRTAR